MRKSLEQFLQASGRLTTDQLRDATRALAFFGGSLLTHLVRLESITEPEAVDLMAEWTGYPPVTAFKLRKIPKELIKLIDPRDVARRKVVAFRLQDGELHVATCNADNEAFFRSLESRAKAKVIPHSLLEERLDPVLERAYGIVTRRETVRTVRVADDSLPPGAVPVSPVARTPSPQPPVTGRGPAAGAPGTSSGLSGRGSNRVSAPEVGLDGLPLNSDREGSAYKGGAGRRNDFLKQFMDTIATTTNPGMKSPVPRSPSGTPAAASRPASVSRVASDAPVRSVARTTTAVPAAPTTQSDSAGPASTGKSQPCLDQLAAARDKAAVGRAIVLLARTLGARRVVLFAVRDTTLVGWEGAGAGMRSEKLCDLSMSLDTPSIFSFFRVQQVTPYAGPVPEQPANAELMEAMGGGEAPTKVLAFPIALKNRLVAVLYIDGGAGTADVPPLKDMRLVADKMAIALEILLLRRKLVS